jgi:novobiocin biosynthesis protein NovU/D-mycarose 3-C-methyltransferase
VRTNHGFAKLLLARHVLAHVADLHDFLFGVRVMLADDGVAVVEVPYLLPFYQNLEYDTIYHEHLCYFSLRVLVQLAEQHDLEVIEVEEAPLHGGSIVVTMQPVGGPHYVRASVDRYLAYEQEVGLHTMPRWREFARRVEQNRQAVRREVEFLIAHGQRVVGYGAAAKGMTLLAACGLGREHLPYIVDRSPRKQGLFTPGHHIPVLPCDRLLLEQPEVVLLLAWNFATEVLQQQAAYRRRGGRFLLPVPMPHYAEIDQPLTQLRAA